MAPRRVPSSAGLPDNWTPEMDEFICYSDAVGDLSVKVTIISLKKRFPQLGPVSRLHSHNEHTLPQRCLTLELLQGTRHQRRDSVLPLFCEETSGQEP